ncbi:hypothetical protein PQX77_021428 [Marasmius sp. AFHP31]|nr:hypothetical protein PQX77_021428 [Marasmius sp. AFHP31]
MAALFSHAQGTTIGDYASFQNVAGNAITTYNYSNSQSKNWIVYNYLNYMNNVAIQSLRDDEGLTFPVTKRWGDWSVNFQTLTFHYNPASLSLNPPTESDLEPFTNHFPPLCQDTIPRLDATEIVAHVEENIGDFLYLIASGGGIWIDNLSKSARNGLLTFGAVIRRRPWHAEILAHFPSTPSPELFCQSLSPDVKARYSNSGQVDLTFRKTGTIKVEIDFGLRIPYDNKTQLCAAYLCQSVHVYDGCRDVEDVIYIDQIGFELEVTFSVDSTTFPTPAYIFISPLHTKLVNGLYYFTSTDKEDWERLGIPELSVRDLTGSYWDDEDYIVVQEVLRQKNYDPDGKRYAREHGYPELILGDPHDTTRIEDLDGSEPLDFNVQPSTSQLASPSTYSLVETSPDSHQYILLLPNENTVAPTRWVKGFLNKYYSKLSDKKLKASQATATVENSGEWDVIEREEV